MEKTIEIAVINDVAIVDKSTLAASALPPNNPRSPLSNRFSFALSIAKETNAKIRNITTIILGRNQNPVLKFSQIFCSCFT